RLAGTTGSSIQLLVAPEDALLIEGNAAVAGEIGLDVRPRGDAVVQFDQPRHLAFKRLHVCWKSVAQAGDKLEQREVDIGRLAPGHVGGAALLHQPLEIAEILWHALLPEFLRALLGGRALVLVIE